MTTAWRRSSFCNGADACVLVSAVDGLVALRDGKDPDGPVLIFTRAEWAAFTAGVRAGEFDAPGCDGPGSVSGVPLAAS